MPKSWNDDYQFINDDLWRMFRGAAIVSHDDMAQRVAEGPTLQIVFVGPHPPPKHGSVDASSLRQLAPLSGTSNLFEHPRVHLVNLSDDPELRDHGRGTEETLLPKRRPAAWLIANEIHRLWEYFPECFPGKRYEFRGAILILLGGEVAEAFRVDDQDQSRTSRKHLHPERWPKYKFYQCTRNDSRPLYFVKFTHPSGTHQNGRRGYPIKQEALEVENILHLLLARPKLKLKKKVRLPNERVDFGNRDVDTTV